MSENLIIAIDGPAASGKSTAAKRLARELGYLYLDTGAMYRAITYSVIKRNIFGEIDKIIDFVKGINLSMKYENGVTRVFVNGEEVTDFIRTPEVSGKVSEISRIPEVRSEMVKLQRKLADEGNLVAEGRDITTVVFPEADVKIYMTASVEERAERRYKEHLERGDEITLDEVLENLKKRDEIDSGREVSPLRKAEDAVELDTTDITVDQELQRMVDLVNEAKNKKFNRQ
ncbi:MAG: (d)CMP kinase [Ignavibacteria bacterium]|nr:MAG: (d)CMP kinase [Ignavibacteria bacterium]